jgi:hypothetical protein
MNPTTNTVDRLNADMLVLRLLKSQLRTVLSLSGDPCQIGCAEGVAARLAVPTKRRPALTIISREDGVRVFALNGFGLAVKSAAIRMGHSL